MTALAFDFDAPAAPAPPRLVALHGGEVEAAPQPRRRLYAVRGSAGEPRAAVPTLDALLGGAWSALGAGYAACPACHEETMTARWSTGHGLASGSCANCGSTLD